MHNRKRTPAALAILVGAVSPSHRRSEAFRLKLIEFWFANRPLHRPSPATIGASRHNRPGTLATAETERGSPLSGKRAGIVRPVRVPPCTTPSSVGGCVANPPAAPRLHPRSARAEPRTACSAPQPTACSPGPARASPHPPSQYQARPGLRRRNDRVQIDHPASPTCRASRAENRRARHCRRHLA